LLQKILRNDIEYIIHSDSVWNIIGPISRFHAHIDCIRSQLTHYSTRSMVYHKESNNYGIQLKNPKKWDKYVDSKWDIGVAGHNRYIEENWFFRPLYFNENLIKEAKEEIGINLEMFDDEEIFKEKVSKKIDKSIGFIFDKFHYKTDINNEWVWLGFIVVPNMEVKFEDKEVVDFRWVSPIELEKYLAQNNNYCSGLPLVFEKAEKFRKEKLV